MNVIFAILMITACLWATIVSPDTVLSSLVDGGNQALNVCLSLFGVYALWMSVAEIAEQSGVARTIGRYSSPLCRRVFCTNDDRTASALSMNLSCNLLGLGGAATPYAVEAIDRLRNERNETAQRLLFVLNATSLQLLPTTVISLRAEQGSANPADIILPSLLASLCCTLVGTGLFLLVRRRRRP